MERPPTPELWAPWASLTTSSARCCAQRKRSKVTTAPPHRLAQIRARSAGTPPGPRDQCRGWDSRATGPKTPAGTPRGAKRSPELGDSVRAQAPPPMTRAQLRTQVTHGGSTEYGLPVGAGPISRTRSPEPPIERVERSPVEQRPPRCTQGALAHLCARRPLSTTPRYWPR